MSTLPTPPPAAVIQLALTVLSERALIWAGFWTSSVFWALVIWEPTPLRLIGATVYAALAYVLPLVRRGEGGA